MMKIRSMLMLSTSLMFLSGTNSGIASTGADFGTIHTSTHTQHLASPDIHLSPNIQLSPSAGTMRTPVRIYAEVMKPLADGVKLPQLASVCFITDTGECSGNSFGSGANTEDGGHGAPGGGSGENNGGSGDDGKDPDYDLDNAERCKKEGYNLTSCNSVQNPGNKCPYDNSYFEKCVCKPGLVTCTKPQYGVGEACGGKYASCQTDNPRACKEDGYTNACPSGQKLKKSPRCQYDDSFGICCTEKCTNNSSTTCTGANTGDDGCGYSCYKCCDDTCPAYTSKTYKGAYTYTTGCGNRCYKCNCPSGTAPNFSGAAAGSAECGTCYRCSNTCSRGQTSVSCSSKYKKVRVGSTECGNSCYECQYNYDCDASRTSCSRPYECNYNSCGICSSCSYNYDCNASSTSCSGKGYSCNYNSCGICSSCSYNRDCDATPQSCSYGCASTNSCGICTSCKAACNPNNCSGSTSSRNVSELGWCDWQDKTQTKRAIWCGTEYSCTNECGDTKTWTGNYHIVKSGMTIQECIDSIGPNRC